MSIITIETNCFSARGILGKILKRFTFLIVNKAHIATFARS